MSQSPNGKYLVCDALGCLACTEAPVSLQPLAKPNAAAEPRQKRWLFVQRGGEWRHFCPEHAETAFSTEKHSLSTLQSLRNLRHLLLIADRSEESFQAAESVAELLREHSDISLTLLFMACAKCPPSEQNLPDLASGTLELERYCPGTRKAVSRLLELFTTQETPRLLFRSGELSMDIVSEEAAQGNYDAIVVAPPTSHSTVPGKHVPLVVIKETRS